MTDLDKSGFGYQRVRTYLGPTLGWVEELVLPATEIKVGGTYDVQPGDSLILVNVPAGVIINLPDVRVWVQQRQSQPATGFDKTITVKDIGGNAQNFNIVVAPFGQQFIDNIQNSVVVSVSRSVIRFIPLIDLTGWAVEVSNVGSSGGGGGGDVFKAGNNTFTGTNAFLEITEVVTELPEEDSNRAASTAWVKDQTYITNAQATTAFQPLDPDLTAIAAISATDTMIYRSGVNAWGTVTIGANLTFSGGMLSATGGGGGGAPIGAQYIVGALDATLTDERLLTDSATVTWDLSVAGQVKANTAAGGGNVSNSGTPAVTQYARWVTATTIEGRTPAQVLTDISAQPLDGDLTSIAALTGTNTIYYRSATSIWSPVTFSGLTFSGGVLAVTGGGGNVIASGVPTLGQTARWTNATTIEGHTVYQNAGTAPVGPSDGDFWYDTTNGILSIRVNDGNSSQWVQVGNGGITTSSASPPQGRLTLQASVPVMTTSQAAKAIIYYTPYQGNNIPIFDGSVFVMTPFAQISVATTDTIKNPAAIAASKVNDWFVWNDAGTLRLSHGPDWTNDTTRSAALNYIFGIWTNSVAITNGPATNRGTYVGTTRSNGTSTLDWIYGGAAAGGVAAVLGVWNAYNRVDVCTTVNDSTASWTVPLGSFPLNNAATGAGLNNRVTAVFGLAEDAVKVKVICSGSNAGVGSNGLFVWVGFDVVTSPYPTTTEGWGGVFGSGTGYAPLVGELSSVPPTGNHFWQAMSGAGAAAMIMIGSGGSFVANEALIFNARM